MPAAIAVGVSHEARQARITKHTKIKVVALRIAYRLVTLRISARATRCPNLIRLFLHGLLGRPCGRVSFPKLHGVTRKQPDP